MDNGRYGWFCRMRGMREDTEAEGERKSPAADNGMLFQIVICVCNCVYTAAIGQCKYKQCSAVAKQQQQQTTLNH